MALRCCCRSDNDGTVNNIEIVDTKQSVQSESLTDVHESQLDEISIRLKVGSDDASSSAENHK